MGRTAMLCVCSPGHEQHDLRDKGYLETPRRMPAIRAGLRTLDLAFRLPRHFADHHITAVHDPALVGFLRASCENVAEGKYEYPYLFPIRNGDRPPKDWSLTVGYYCIDTFTPIHRHAYTSARVAVNAALTAATAHYLSSRGRVAMLDLDYHHGNGQQHIRTLGRNARRFFTGVLDGAG